MSTITVPFPIRERPEIMNKLCLAFSGPPLPPHNASVTLSLEFYPLPPLRNVLGIFLNFMNPDTLRIFLNFWCNFSKNLEISPIFDQNTWKT